MFYDDVEGLDRGKLRKLQVERLRQTLKRAAKAPHYAKALKDAGAPAPQDIRTPEDAARLPFTVKDDLRAAYPYGLLAKDVSQMVRLHASSGTTGAPVAVLYTEKDIRTWAKLCARSFYATGVRPHHVLQNMAGYGLFTGGLGIHYGAEALGCLTVPAGAGNTKRQIKLIRDFGVNALHIIPSYALHLGTVLEKEGIAPEDFPPSIALIGAEPHTEEARQRIEKMLGLKAFNSYGLSEMNGPGVAFECTEQSGMHIWEDAYLVEVVDPTTGELLDDGEYGELVLTTLTREGMPLLRYRTRDLTRIIPGDCPCGRTHRRIDRIAGRTDDMLIIKGVNIYPMQVEQILMAMPEVGDNYQIVLEREGVMDRFRVLVEVRDAYFVEDMRVLRGLQERIAHKLRDEILITPKVQLVQRGHIERGPGKAQRVVDKRES